MTKQAKYRAKDQVVDRNGDHWIFNELFGTFSRVGIPHTDERQEHFAVYALNKKYGPLTRYVEPVEPVKPKTVTEVFEVVFTTEGHTSFWHESNLESYLATGSHSNTTVTVKSAVQVAPLRYVDSDGDTWEKRDDGWACVRWIEDDHDHEPVGLSRFPTLEDVQRTFG